ncbi:OsmC family protein [Neobacillus sp. WH10]|uniref:OsmC family protein n=1 Tax=Neobacillus sp. WH10 TaxID=3047873 RepID=UPI0024C14845|nr:OsmC family protein [Neobacillus sp. WH10]WHY78415.1 OsmC family protein [Neobacillus sp. WH10]
MNNINFEAVKKVTNNIKENPELGMKKWTAHLKWKDGTENEAFIRDFTPLIIDEPIELGGTNKGANPVEFLITAAVSCFTITFEVFASQAGIKLEEVSVDIEADLNVAVFLGIEEGERGILNPVIKLRALTSASKEKVEEIANQALTVSPVLKSLNTMVALVVE